MGVLLLFFIYWIQFWVYEYSMHALNILSLNVNGLDSAVKRARVLEYLHRGSIFCALIQEAYLICGTGLRHLLVSYLFVTLHSQCFFFFFSFNVHDYIKEWLVLFFLFPSLSLFLLTGLFGVLSMCLLFCLFWVDVMLWCCVLKEIKKLIISSTLKPVSAQNKHDQTSEGKLKERVQLYNPYPVSCNRSIRVSAAQRRQYNAL